MCQEYLGFILAGTGSAGHETSWVHGEGSEDRDERDRGDVWRWDAVSEDDILSSMPTTRAGDRALTSLRCNWDHHPQPA